MIYKTEASGPLDPHHLPLTPENYHVDSTCYLCKIPRTMRLEENAPPGSQINKIHKFMAEAGEPRVGYQWKRSETQRESGWVTVDGEKGCGREIPWGNAPL